MLSKIISLAFAASFILSASAAPTILEGRDDSPWCTAPCEGHQYQCPSNFTAGTHKVTLQGENASATDLAITIQETSCQMNGQAYLFGDIYPNGTQKTGDAANFGLFKNNWLQIRTHCTGFTQYGPGDYAQGNILNTNDTMAISCQHDQMNAIGMSAFYAAQRGEGDGSDYATAIAYIQSVIEQHLTDDTVTYYNLTNI